MNGTPPPNASSPKYEITNEVRFAVVMYGGVSLAIYINGVAQELLRLVRSTAPCKPNGATLAGGELSGTERVYRKLSYLLSDADLLARMREHLRAVEEGGAGAAGVVAELNDHVATGDLPINTRFVIDIMSGTSAGGINAIYLAKALANEQGLDDLKRLWVSEGDIGLLMNDSKSVKDLKNLASQVPPKSLLNSRRMYYKLLYALHAMGGDSQRKSPYVEDLDLFITTTDIKGLTLPLQLADKLVYERRHRSVFHFRYSAKDGDNDFTKDYNPFLAFAARSTSSFPFAFEPMLLSDIDQILEWPEFAADYDNERCRSGSRRWKRFFTEYLKNDATAPQWGSQREINFVARAFGDGGYLDNKPFSYSTSTLARRHANVPVDRKLIYIEPSPEHPEDEDVAKPAGDGGKSPDRPDVLANVKAALLDLPSYETIREDLQRVLERNRFLNRVNRIISAIEEDVNQYESTPKSESTVKRLKQGEWVTLDLVDMLDSYGVSYLPYHRLRIAATRDALASMVASARGYDIDSDYFLAIRCVIGAWRDSTYVEYYKNREDRGRQKTLNRFLADFDLNYQLRRLSFLRKKIDQLYRCSREAAGGETGREARPAIPVPTDRYSKDLVRRLAGFGLDLRDEAQRRSYRETLSFIKCRLNELYDELLALDAQLRMTPAEASLDADAKTPGAKTAEAGVGGAKSPAEELRDLVGGIGLTKEHLNYVLSGEWGERAKGQTEDGAALRDEASARLDPGALSNPAVAAECSGTGEPVSDSQPAEVYCGEASYAREAECVRRARNLLDPLNAEKFCLGELRERLDRAAEGLAGQIDAVVRRTIPERENSGAGAEDSGGKKKNRTGLILEEQSAWTSGGGCAQKVKTELLNPDYDVAIRDYLYGFYRDFDFYDQISFPVLYNTDVGEADTVEVIRVSPEDATTLIDERGGATSRRKLAGTAFHHFGAFLDRVWRENDIMWGRLDGAERLIASLLPGEENRRVRDALIKEAHTAILSEELPQKSRDDFTREVIRSLQFAKSSASPSTQEAVAKIMKRWAGSDDFEASLLSVMRGALDDEGLLKYMRDDYEVDRQLDPKSMLRVMARSTQIIGKLFEDVANQNNLDGQNLRWVARLGQFFWGLVEVAVPDKLRNRFASYWLHLLYVFWLVVFAGSLVFQSSSTRNFAMTAFLATGLTHALILILRDHMLRRHRWAAFFATLLALLILALAVFGGYHAYQLYDDRFNESAEESRQK